MAASGWGSISERERTAFLKCCSAFEEARIRSRQWLREITLQGPRTAETLRVKAGCVFVTDDSP
jgi:hypothetical protein